MRFNPVEGAIHKGKSVIFDGECSSGFTSVQSYSRAVKRAAQRVNVKQ